MIWVKKVYANGFRNGSLTGDLSNLILNIYESYSSVIF